MGFFQKYLELLLINFSQYFRISQLYIMVDHSYIFHYRTSHIYLLWILNFHYLFFLINLFILLKLFLRVCWGGKFHYITALMVSTFQSIWMYNIRAFLNINPRTPLFRQSFHSILSAHLFFWKITIIIFKVNTI